MEVGGLKRYGKSIGETLECGGKGEGGREGRIHCCNSNQFERRAGRKIRRDRWQAFENGAGGRAGGRRGGGEAGLPVLPRRKKATT